MKKKILVEDLWPGDVVRAREPGLMFGTPRRISDIIPGTSNMFIHVLFDDGLKICCRPEDVIKGEDVFHLAKVK